MKPLYAENFFNDSRVADAMSAIIETLRDYQQSFDGVKPADPDRKESYDALLEQCAALRGGGLYYPFLGSGFGRGPLVELCDGSVKYDFITGIGVHYFGHSHPDMMRAALDGALADTLMQGNLQQNDDSVTLMQAFVDLAQRDGGDLSHCFLTTSGAMANENALKLAFQKHSPADRILCFKHCFSGRTMALAQMTDKAAYRDGLPVAMEVDYVPFFDANDPEGSTQKAVGVLKRHLTRFPKKYAAMCMELIQGEGGYYPGQTAYFKALIDVLRAHDVAVWFDEIQTFGRTTKPFAFQHFGLSEHADIVTVGKMSQVCATLFRPEYKPRPGLISQTFTASGSVVRGATLTLKTMAEGDLFGESGKIIQLHDHFKAGLEALGAKHDITGPYGFGAMIAMTVFGGDVDKTKAFVRALFDAGVIAFIAGASPMRVRFLMPMAAVTTDDIDEVLRIIGDVLDGMAKENG